MSYIKLNGVTFDADVAISKYTRYFNVLDGDNAGRVMTGRMVRDVIGTYLGHKVTVFRRGGWLGGAAVRHGAYGAVRRSERGLSGSSGRAGRSCVPLLRG